MIPPDHQQVLAMGRIPARRVIVHAAVTRVYAIDDGITEWSAALDNSPAHDPYLVVDRISRKVCLGRKSKIRAGCEERGLRIQPRREWSFNYSRVWRASTASESPIWALVATWWRHFALAAILARLNIF